MEKEQQVNLIDGFTEACKVRGYDPETVIPDVSSYPEHLRAALIAAAKLFIITEASNQTPEGPWKPDYNNFEEKKWFPYFDMEKSKSNPSGFGFYGALYVLTASYVGSRLSYRTAALARHAGTAHESLYRDLMVQ